MTERSPAVDPREVLERILTSRSFARAGQLRRLLSYLVEAAVEGREGTLKETVIGVEVFGLPTNFDPKSDPVVRMGMRRLRNRLQQYYQNDGARDPIFISLEPGRYVPRFLPKSSRDAQRVSIAVLPFACSDEDSEEDPEMGGLLREALLTRLMDDKSFHLVANESASLGAINMDLDAFAKKWPAQFVLRGACVTGGGKVQIATELFCTEDSKTLWSGNHEQDAAAEVWTVQNDIVAEVCKRALTRSQGLQETALALGSEHGIYRLIVQGRYYLNQNNLDALKKSAQCFRAAVEQQGTSALAWAGLSVAQTFTAIYHMQPAQRAWREAALSADRAVALNPSLPEGQLALGLLATFSRFKPAEAGTHFGRGLTANSEDNALRLANAMTHLAPLGRLQEAEDQLEAVLASDPLNPKALQLMAIISYFQRRYGTAVELALAALDILPGSITASFTLANCYERLGNDEQALKYFRKCEELAPFLRVLKWSTVIASIYKGRTKWVRPTVLAAAKLLQASSRTPSAMVADALIRVGEPERAIKWMERAFRERAMRALFLGTDPAFDAIREDSRCRDLLLELQGSPSAPDAEKSHEVSAGSAEG